MPGVTLDEFPGERLDEGIVLDDLPGGSDPPQLGGIRLVSGSFRMRDSLGVFNPRNSGSFVSGSGINEQEHENLDTLTHFNTRDSYDEVIYAGLPPRIVQVITWDSPSKSYKITQSEYSYTGRRLVQIIDTQYTTGTIKYSVTESISYVDPFSNKVANITRDRS